MQWSPIALDALLDVDGIIAYWHDRGLIVHRTPALRPFPDLSVPERAYPQYPLPLTFDPSQATR